MKQAENSNDESFESLEPVSKNTIIARVVGLLFLCLVTGSPFVAAGSIDWTEGWVLVVVLALASVSAQLYMKRHNPELLKHRERAGRGTKPWDRAWLGAFRLMLLGMLVVAGLDAVRYSWTTTPWWLSLVGVVLVALGWILSTWSMAENPHFEGTVRIQHDRGHRVIDTGPYALVRHPGYVGVALLVIGMPLVLRSLWALALAGVAVLWIMLRTWLEDRILKNELNGYPEYTRRVRFKLIPRLW